MSEENEANEKVEKKEVPVGPTPGAGVNPERVVNRNKRFKRDWRASDSGLSLRAWARELDEAEAEDWFYRKSPAYTGDAKKDRRDRVNVARLESRANKPAGGKGKR